jgi:uncharacterized membrane-anchored protein YhcB (DUF1043 family)
MAESTNKEITKVEYFGMRDIAWYIAATLIMGLIMGSSIAHYKDYRFREISNSIKVTESDYEHFEQAREEVDSQLAKSVQDLIDGMMNLQSYSKCHERSTKVQLFPDWVKFEEKPLIMVSQSKILLILYGDTRRGSWEAPENPVTVIQSGKIWASYDVELPPDSKSSLCVFFFENHFIEPVT